MRQDSRVENNVKPGMDLIIRTAQKNILSKQQQAFNRLVKKIEKLRLDLNELNTSLEAKLDFYGKHIYPVEKQLAGINKEAVKLLYPFFKDKKLLTKKDRQQLGKAIGARLDEIFKLDDQPDEELRKIFKAVEGISYEDASELGFETMKNEIQSIFENNGLDVNFDEMNSKMSPEEMMKKITEMQDRLNGHQEKKSNNSKAGKKTKKQQEKEDREKQLEEARTKNIGSIYRQLAKVIHPDLEQNEELKLKKEELMKQLTIAYENNDLHTLLSLELAWIQKEDDAGNKLTDDKLYIYNEVLKEQVYELEQEISDTLHNPRFQPLQKFNIFPEQLKTMSVKSTKQQIEATKKYMTKIVADLKGTQKQALSAVKEIINAFEEEAFNDFDEYVFSEFFK